MSRCPVCLRKIHLSEINHNKKIKHCHEHTHTHTLSLSLTHTHNDEEQRYYALKVIFFPCNGNTPLSAIRVEFPPSDSLCSGQCCSYVLQVIGNTVEQVCRSLWPSLHPTPSPPLSLQLLLSLLLLL